MRDVVNAATPVRKFVAAIPCMYWCNRCTPDAIG
jgi:hypothetical protein